MLIIKGPLGLCAAAGRYALKLVEYNYARYLLCSSLKRICKIQDKVKRKELIQKTWNMLNEKYPNWKKNKILNNSNTGKNIYMKTVNKFTYKIYAKIFKVIN